MAALCSGGNVRTYSKRRSLNPGLRSKSSAAILAQAFFVRPFALLVLLSRASSPPPWSCSRRRRGNTECSSLGRLRSTPEKNRPQLNKRGRGKSGVLRFRPLVAANGEGNDIDLVKRKRAPSRRSHDGGTKVAKHIRRRSSEDLVHFFKICHYLTQTKRRNLVRRHR